MKEIYVLEKIKVICNYPYPHTIKEGGIVGFYYPLSKAESRRDEIIKAKGFTQEDFSIFKLECDIGITGAE